MPPYRAPGVYVEEVPPLARPIAGVGTSTAGFIGVVGDTVKIPSYPLPGETTPYRWVQYRVSAAPLTPYRITSWTQFVNLFGDFVWANNTPPTTEGKVLAEGKEQEKKYYIAGKTDPGLLVTATWDSKTGTGEADKLGAFKIEIDKLELTNVKVTTTVSADGADVDLGWRHLAHAVFGFFNNGGTSCYVVRIQKDGKLKEALAALATEDEIAMVVAPGFANRENYAALEAHCELLKDRVAILDSVDNATVQDLAADVPDGKRPQNSSYAAFYFPWIQVFDPASSLMNPADRGLIYVPPSGHVAGVYARSDTERGVFKAPANEALRGVTGVKCPISKADQESLNPVGVNAIRPLIGAFRIWGARTVGGDANGEYRYISTRRYMNYLRESIDEGTQFVVFEPNSPALWQRITRTVSDFLTNEWRSGALFGEKAEQAFFVRCNDHTNPKEVRDAGQVVTEIGVAIVKPAEFVIFRIQQTTGG